MKWCRVSVAAVVAATMSWVVGCGFVEDDPAGSPAPNDRQVVTPTVTTVPTPTLPDGSPSPTLPDGSPSPTLPDGSPSPTLPDGAPNPVAGVDPSDPVRPPSRPTTVPTLTDADLRAIARCEAIRRFQDAGTDVLIVSIRRSPELVSVMRRFKSVSDELLVLLEPQIRSQVEPAVSSVRVAVPGVELRSPEELIAEWNGVLVSSVPLWQRAIRALSVTCPSAIPAETVDQVAVFRLGMDLPDGIDPEVAFR